MNAPIFIVGANRSGTTLLRLMLNAHSRIAIPEETAYFKSGLGNMPIERWHSHDLSEADYRTFVLEILDSNPILFDVLSRPALEQELLNSSQRDLRRPLAHTLERWAQAQGKARWGEKTPGNLFFADVILAMFPDAHFIHLTRDPRAGVASMQKVDFFPNSVYFNALSRRKHARVAHTMQDLIPEDQWMTIRYEDLVSDPAPTLRRLCIFLEEKFESSMLQFYRDSAQYMKDEAASSFNVAATRPVTSERTEKWREELSPREVAIIESICASEMQEYGYRPSGSPVGLTDRIALFVHIGYWTLQQWRHRNIREFTVKAAIFARSRSRLSSRLARWFPSVAASVHP